MGLAAIAMAAAAVEKASFFDVFGVIQAGTDSAPPVSRYRAADGAVPLGGNSA
ncbi:hypothetical protein ABIB15_001521 [Marisediminicola sp. UYEF4]|uniref:hypothetical protein n=1 Tax=Marisediminicola sp. UYEF4 TaxID=1756384 RepID=UPI003398BF6F